MSLRLIPFSSFVQTYALSIYVETFEKSLDLQTLKVAVHFIVGFVFTGQLILNVNKTTIGGIFQSISFTKLVETVAKSDVDKPQRLSDGNALNKPNGDAFNKPNGDAFNKPNGDAFNKPNGDAFNKPNGDALNKPNINFVKAYKHPQL